MGTGAPETRKTHVIRILGTNRAGERLTDVYVDVERIDEMQGTLPGDAATDANYQGFKRKLRWMDDPRSDEYNPDGNPTRKTKKVKICDPETQDVDDPDEYVEIDVIEGFTMRASENNYQKTVEKFRSTDDQQSREFTVRKIVKCDTNIDDEAEAAFNADSSLKVYVVPGDQYTKDLDTKDEDQYVEQEIITKTVQQTNSTKRPSGGSDQKRRTKWKNQYLLDSLDQPDGEVIGAGGINPPYRLDPYQNILNVKFEAQKAVMVGMRRFGQGSGGVNDTGLVSNDGNEWESFVGTTAASGFGKTVVTSEEDFVVFGKPRDGDRCFIIARQSGAIERGVMVDGNLVWTIVGSVPLDGEAVFSISFAGGAFFISYGENAGVTAYFAVSFDGVSFSMGISPWSGIVAATNGSGEDGNRTPEVLSGVVAYDPDREVYVTVGYYTRHYRIFYIGNNEEEQSVGFFDENFMSATSSNGLSWTPKYDTSEIGGLGGPGPDSIGGPNVSTSSSVAFGNGVFVAAASYKVGLDSGGLAGDLSKIFIATNNAAACVSSDGVNWSYTALPDNIVDLHGGSTGSSVVFVKKKIGNFDGFFVMGSVTYGDGLGPVGDAHLYYSLDGTGWSVVRTTEPDFGWVMSILNKNRGEIVYK